MMARGFWLAQKRLSKGRFRWWPEGRSPREVARSLAAHQLRVLLAAAIRRLPGGTGVAAGGRDELKKVAGGAYVLISTPLRCGAWKESLAIGAG
jgi:hypothetical protein